MSEEIGWWKHPSHVRKCSQAVHFNFQATVAKGHAHYVAKERRESIKLAARTFVIVAGFLAGLAFVALLVSGGLR